MGLGKAFSRFQGASSARWRSKIASIMTVTGQGLPTLLTAGAKAAQGAKEVKVESAPEQEVMITEGQKHFLADIQVSRTYECLNCGTTIAGRAMQLRRNHFPEIGAKVDKDDMGCPTVRPYMLHYNGHPFTGGTATTMPNIEMFQRDNIFFCSLMGGLCYHMYEAGICCSAACTLMSSCCASEQADSGLLTSTLDDSFFNEIFNMHFGGTMLRGPLSGENTLQLKSPVICDLQTCLEDLEVRESRLFEPCKVLFSQDDTHGLLVEAIIMTGAEDSTNPTVYRKGISSSNEWLRAKRLAVAAAVQRHQYREHLVNGHMVMETFMALAYKHLSGEHYVFKLMEPVGGDVGFVNTTWGVDLLLLNSGAPYEACLHLMSPQPLLTPHGVHQQVTQAQQSFEPGSWFWFDEGGYMKTGCGVKESTPFALRHTAQQLFDVTLAWTSLVVSAFWQERDEALNAWWQAIWWKQMKPAKRELSQANLSHLLATCILQCTYVHDLAHESWLPDNHSKLVWKPTNRGQGTNPEDYLPSSAEQTISHLGFMALNGASLESPLLSYRKVFPDDQLKEALKSFEDNLARIVLNTPYMTKIGSMSH